jgi:hypothetical protein
MNLVVWNVNPSNECFGGSQNGSSFYTCLGIIEVLK